MDLIGQLHNPSLKLQDCLDLRIERGSARSIHRPRRAAARSNARVVRKALIEILKEDGFFALRLTELKRRVESRIGESVSPARFKDYVNEQSRGRKAILERVGYGQYRLR
jgi:hypothetical protein